VIPALEVRDVEKAFRLYAQGGVRLRVLRGVSLAVWPGECVVLGDPSGAGKSTLLRAIYGNYLVDRGHILVRDGDRIVDLVGADPRTVLALRRRTIGYVSQFLRVIPRVPALQVVAQPLRALGVPRAAAEARAATLLGRLAVPERLWGLSPTTFSGGEQQRVNVARGFVVESPVLLLDEPTAALDADSRERVAALVEDARTRGAAIVGTFHDAEVRERVATRIVSLHDARDVPDADLATSQMESP
jgi:alpha-D-ribose 1-methylphosphonate 5-triphosphate synthase subunit PhnL